MMFLLLRNGSLYLFRRHRNKVIWLALFSVDRCNLRRLGSFGNLRNGLLFDRFIYHWCRCIIYGRKVRQFGTFCWQLCVIYCLLTVVSCLSNSILRLLLLTCISSNV